MKREDSHTTTNLNGWIRHGECTLLWFTCEMSPHKLTDLNFGFPADVAIWKVVDSLGSGALLVDSEPRRARS